MMTTAERRGENSASFRMLADSIKKFGNIYEKNEIGKRRQTTEFERMRNGLDRRKGRRREKKKRKNR